MKVVVFDQWEKLCALLRTLAGSAAAERTQYALNRVEAKDGRVRLADRAANALAVTGGTTAVEMPDIVPGRARDFMLRVSGRRARAAERRRDGRLLLHRDGGRRPPRREAEGREDRPVGTEARRREGRASARPHPAFFSQDFGRVTRPA